MKALGGKVAVITGAGGGFGREFARQAAREKMMLALADIDADGLQQTVDELQAGGSEVLGRRLDVCAEPEVAAFAADVERQWGAADLLINNAGVAGGGFIWENSAADWHWIFGVNVFGIVNALRHFVPAMLRHERQRGAGHIVNVASVAGWLAPPLMGVYNASKHAVAGLTESLYHDLRLAQSAIGVSLLCPAFVPTGIAQSHRNRPRDLANETAPTASQRAAQEASEKAVAAGRLTAAEVAQMTFDAIRANRYSVFTHPQIKPAIRARFEALLADQPPADPFGEKPAARPTV